MKSILTVLAVLSFCFMGTNQDRKDISEATTLIDTHIQRTWDQLKLRPVPDAGDAGFLRRLSLDVTGTIPTVEEVEAFLKDGDPKRRVKKVNEYLNSPMYARYWSQLWTALLVGWFEEDADRYSREDLRKWIEDQLTRNIGWNKIAQGLLSATGTRESNPSTNYLMKYLTGGGPEDLTTRVSRTFFGIRMNCAQCHDHPFDSWKRDDFFGMTSFFARTQATGVQRGASFVFERLSDVPNGEGYAVAGTGKPGVPRFLNGSGPMTSQWRQDFTLFTSRSPQMARAAVNRVWAALMGRGLVHPPDNFSRKNPPSHPDLLEKLTEDFKARGYDLKYLIRSIVESQAYQLSSENTGQPAGNEKYFIYFIQKPLSPYQFFNSAIRACGLEESYRGEPDRLSRERQQFGRQFEGALGEDPFDPGSYQETSQHLMTKLSAEDFLNRAESEEGGRLQAIVLESEKRRIELLYLAVLGRYPMEKERRLCRDHVTSVEGDSPAPAYRDILYALMNSHEFNYTH